MATNDDKYRRMNNIGIVSIPYMETGGIYLVGLRTSTHNASQAFGKAAGIETLGLTNRTALSPLHQTVTTAFNNR
jgi:hypothetical protein